MWEVGEHSDGFMVVYKELVKSLKKEDKKENEEIRVRWHFLIG